MMQKNQPLAPVKSIGAVAARGTTSAHQEAQAQTQTQAGFSILELIVAVFIISVILTAVAANMTRAAKSLWESKARFYAVNMAQNCVEEFNYANKKFDWRAFYEGGGSGVALDSLCTVPASKEAIDYLCCGDDCRKYDGLAGAEVPECVAPTADEADRDDGEPLPLVVTDDTYEEDAGNPATLTERIYYDEDSDTIFTFTIKRNNGTVTYQQRRYSYDGGPAESVPVKKQTVVLTIDVTWDKYSASVGGDANHYKVVKQYLEVY